jgi:uncharacterized protein (TIGR02466 family)
MEAVDKALASLQQRVLFPTTIMQTNLADAFDAGWCDRIADLAEQKYADFGRIKVKNNGGQPVDPNDLNDAFFSWQETRNEALDSKEAQRKWTELYRDSKDFQFLRKVMQSALLEYARRSGLELPPKSQDNKDYHDMVLWAAVYPGVTEPGQQGGRHGYHVHQNSLVSCVAYVRTQGSEAGPIVFVDPRGAPPTNDYEQHIGERDFEPTAPFHRNEYVFPETGTLVCFPSWLVHTVPSQRTQASRVAFAANLQARGSWDAWQRTAVL